jgi:ArsR family transcriptional regulator, arsenate/arsenite/antimonite-responsive transcriptional repressor
MDEIFQALADPTRLAVFQCLRGCGGEVTYDAESGGLVACCDVRCVVPCAPSTLTHHLNVLRNAGLIETVRKGREVFARVVPDGLAKIERFAQAATPCACVPEACACR